MTYVTLVWFIWPEDYSKPKCVKTVYGIGKELVVTI